MISRVTKITWHESNNIRNTVSQSGKEDLSFPKPSQRTSVAMSSSPLHLQPILLLSGCCLHWVKSLSTCWFLFYTIVREAVSLLLCDSSPLNKKKSVFYFQSSAAAKSFQSCPTLRDPIDGSPPGSPVPGILQARTLEWVATSFSNAWKWKVKVKSLSRVRLFATPWTAAYQVPPSMGFSRQEYWSGVPLPR